MASCSEYGRERDRAIKHAWGLNYYFSPRARYHWDVSKEYLRISVELEKAARGDPETVENLLLDEFTDALRLVFVGVSVVFAGGLGF